MASSDPRISDRELAAINAAAVTREYRVQPHLGTIAYCLYIWTAETDVASCYVDYRTVSAINGCVFLGAQLAICDVQFSEMRL